MHKIYKHFITTFIILYLYGCSTPGIHRNDLSKWKVVNIQSVNLRFEIPVDVDVEEFIFRLPRSTGTERGASFKMHKYIPKGFAEYRFVISFMIFRFDRKEWQAYVNTYKKGTPEFMADPYNSDIIINKTTVRKKDRHYIVLMKDITTQRGEMIRIEAHINTLLDSPENLYANEKVVLRIINSMKPIKK